METIASPDVRKKARRRLLAAATGALLFDAALANYMVARAAGHNAADPPRGPYVTRIENPSIECRKVHMTERGSVWDVYLINDARGLTYIIKQHDITSRPSPDASALAYVSTSFNQATLYLPPGFELPTCGR